MPWCTLCLESRPWASLITRASRWRAQPAATAYLASPKDAEPGLSMLLNDGSTPMNALNRRIHYSAWPKYFGKDKKEAIAHIYDRVQVPWSKVRGRECLEAKDCAADESCQPLGDASYCAAKQLSPGVPLVEVPYRFCSDEYFDRLAEVYRASAKSASGT